MEDVLSRRTFRPFGSSVIGTFCHWDILSLGRFVLGTLCLGTFCLGTFCLGTFCLYINQLLNLLTPAAQGTHMSSIVAEPGIYEASPAHKILA